VTKLTRPPALAAVYVAALLRSTVLVRSPIDDDEEELTIEGGDIYISRWGVGRGEKGRIRERE